MKAFSLTVMVSGVDRMLVELVTAALRERKVRAMTTDSAQLATPFQSNHAEIYLIIATAANLDVADLIYDRRRKSNGMIVILGIVSDDDDIRRLLQLGADACVFSDQPLDELIEVLHGVKHGHTPCSPRATGVLFRSVARLARMTDVSPTTTNLTVREQHVLSLVASGLSNKQIGEALSISLHTVKNHVHSILAKLQLRHRWEILSLVPISDANSRSA